MEGRVNPRSSILPIQTMKYVIRLQNGRLLCHTSRPRHAVIYTERKGVPCPSLTFDLQVSKGTKELVEGDTFNEVFNSSHYENRLMISDSEELLEELHAIAKADDRQEQTTLF